jgi:hypothetical protein
MKTKNALFRLAIIFAFVSTLIGCGGNGGGTPPPAGTPVVSQGSITALGSITVNGIKFEDTLANITADDTAKTPSFLQTGMTVKVSGRRNDDGITGTADRIEVENEVRGAVAGLSGDTFTVLGQTVVVDGGTVLDGGISFSGGTISGLLDGNEVEVHGQRDATGVIRATRVEKLGADAEDEVKGLVSNAPGGILDLGESFDIGTLSIATNASTAIVPEGSVVADGTLVEVHLAPGAPATATRIEVEDAEDAEFEPAEGQEFEVEGFISDFNPSFPNDFFVNGVEVHVTNSTRFEGGVVTDLGNDVKVEAEGHMIGGVLVANKITFKDTVRFEANADGNASAGVLGRTVVATSMTELINLPTGIGAILAGDGLRIRGFLNNDGTTITATRIEKLSNPVTADKIILQGPVSSLNSVAMTLVIVGITVNASAVPANEIQNDNDQVITIDQFFASLTANRTIVKARGSFSPDTLTADKIEIE